MLQIFALFWVMFGINCTRINQSQPRNISLYIIISDKTRTASILNSWVSLGPFSVILSGGQPKMYWWLYCTGASKPHEIAHICCQTQGQRIQWIFFSVWWQCIDLELTPVKFSRHVKPKNSFKNDSFYAHPCVSLFTKKFWRWDVVYAEKIKAKVFR